MTYSKYLFFILGMVFVVLGVVGIILPVMPTTPFLILAVYCFSKSHEKFYFFLLQHPRFGRGIFNWFNFGAISIKAKKWSIVMMTLSLIVFSVLSPFWELSLLLFVVLFLVSFFIYSRPSEYPTVYLVLGYGDVAKNIVNELLQQNSNKRIKIYITSRNPQQYGSNKYDKNKVSFIEFDSSKEQTWQYLPFADVTFWNFPCKEEKTVLSLWEKKRHLLGKVIGIGTTSIYSEDTLEWTKEESLKNQEHSRWKIEEHLISGGAIWGIAAGLYDDESHPSRWMSSPRVHPDNYVNLIHKEDCARAVIYLSEHGKPAEIYNLSDGQAYLWKDLAESFLAQNIISQDSLQNFLAREMKKSEKKSKKISNKKLLELGFQFKYTLVKD